MTTPGDPTRTPKIDYGRPPTGASPVGPTPTGPTTPAPRTRGGPGWVTYAITVLAFLIVIVVVVFVTQNTTRIDIKFFGTTKRLSVAAALGGSAAAGLVVGLLLASVPQVRLRRELRQLRREVR